MRTAVVANDREDRRPRVATAVGAFGLVPGRRLEATNAVTINLPVRHRPQSTGLKRKGPLHVRLKLEGRLRTRPCCEAARGSAQHLSDVSCVRFVPQRPVDRCHMAIMAAFTDEG